MLRYVGFPETRSVWWEALERQPPGHARLEVVAARSPAALAAFDAAVAAAGPPLETALRTRVPPGARVLVAGEGAIPQAEHREVVRFTPAVSRTSRMPAAPAPPILRSPLRRQSGSRDRPELRRHVRSGYPLVAEQPGEFALHSLVARRAASA